MSATTAARNSRSIKYTKGNWKYKLLEDCFVPCKTGINKTVTSHSGLFIIYSDGVMVREGYAWDGASGPTIDTTNSMLAGLIHDVLYQAIREGLIPKRLRRRADRIFRILLRESGMSLFRRVLWFYAVRIFGIWAVK